MIMGLGHMFLGAVLLWCVSRWKTTKNSGDRRDKILSEAAATRAEAIAMLGQAQTELAEYRRHIAAGKAIIDTLLVKARATTGNDDMRALEQKIVTTAMLREQRAKDALAAALRSVGATDEQVALTMAAIDKE